MSHYVVTGGAGFIGSNIVKKLAADGKKVTVIDNLSTGRIENVQPFLKKIEFIEGSVTDERLVRKALKGADYLLHQAAIPSVARSVKDPLKSNEANVAGTLTLLCAARDAKIKCLTFASSSSIYGNYPKLPKREDFPPNPLSPYAVTKATGEYYIQVFARLYGINAVCLRYFNVFGPHQDPASQYAAVIPKFIKIMAAGKRPVIYGDGLQSRDFTYVDNVVSANLLACRNLKKSPGLIMNVACGARYSLLDLVAYINKILGTAIEPQFAAAAPGDVKHSLADISAAKKHLKYRPLVDFRSGLRQTVTWMREHYDNAR